MQPARPVIDAVARQNLHLVLRALAPLGFALLAACSSPADHGPIAARSASLAPTPQVVPATQVVSSACDDADRRGGMMVVVDDDDMIPTYPRGTALVAERADYASLQEGMMVLFRLSRGGTDAHVLVLRTPDGWVTRALAHHDDDPDLITPERYVGKVVAAYRPAPIKTASN